MLWKFSLCKMSTESYEQIELRIKATLTPFEQFFESVPGIREDYERKFRNYEYNKIKYLIDDFFQKVSNLQVLFTSLKDKDLPLIKNIIQQHKSQQENSGSITNISDDDDDPPTLHSSQKSKETKPKTLKEYEKEIKKLNKEIKDLKNSKDKLLKEKNELQRKYDNLKLENSNLTTDKKNLKNENTKLRKDGSKFLWL